MNATEYIAKQKSPQKEIIVKLRKIILKEGLKETMYVGVPWYEKFYLVGLKDSVNMGFCVDGLNEKEMTLLKGKGKLMRHLKFKNESEIKKEDIVKLIKLIRSKTKTCLKNHSTQGTQ